MHSTYILNSLVLSVVFVINVPFKFGLLLVDSYLFHIWISSGCSLRFWKSVTSVGMPNSFSPYSKVSVCKSTETLQQFEGVYIYVVFTLKETGLKWDIVKPLTYFSKTNSLSFWRFTFTLLLCGQCEAFDTVFSNLQK